MPEGAFAETKYLIAGWYIIDVESWDAPSNWPGSYPGRTIHHAIRKTWLVAVT